MDTRIKEQLINMAKVVLNGADKPKYNFSIVIETRKFDKEMTKKEKDDDAILSNHFIEYSDWTEYPWCYSQNKTGKSELESHANTLDEL